MDRSSRGGASCGGACRKWEEALARLAAIDPKFRVVVEMRVFEGLTGEEIAAQLGCSARTVASYWNFAKNWLAEELAMSPGAALGELYAQVRDIEAEQRRFFLDSIKAEPEVFQKVLQLLEEEPEEA